MDKLLIISYSFPPDNAPAAQRPYFMSKYLDAVADLDVLVLTTNDSLSSLAKSKWADTSALKIIYTEKNASPVNKDQKKVSGKPKKIFRLLQPLGQSLLIPDKGILWFKKACRRIDQLMQEEPDIKYIFTTSPLYVNHMLGGYIKKRYDVKWIADVRDFYYCANREKEFSLRKIIDRQIERNVLTKADHITFISHSMKDEYCKSYSFLERKSSVIYNGFDKDEFNFDVSEKPTSQKLTVFYGGSFYGSKRSPAGLIKAFEALVRSGKLSVEDFEIRIAGNIPLEVFENFKGYKVYSSIKLLGFLPRKEVIKEMLKAHFLWLIIANEIAHYAGFPVKGYEYIGARKHILAFTPVPSEPSRIIEELQCGTVFNLNDPDTKFYAEKLLKLYERYKAGEFDNPIIIDEKKLEKYTRKYQAKQLYELLK